MGIDFIRKANTLMNMPHPIRFIASRVVGRSGLGRFVTMDFGNYKLRAHPAAISMSLLVDRRGRDEDVDLIARILRPGDHFIDVGANIGQLTCAAAGICGSSGQVTAFEAHPIVAGWLRENVALNKLSNVRIAQAACGSKNGWVSFTNQRLDDLNSVAYGDSDVTDVPMVRVDDFAEEREVTLIKIDVEGYELHVLEGARRTLQNTLFVYFEAWSQHFCRFGYSYSAIHRLLEELGFKVYLTEGTALTQVEETYPAETCKNLLAVRSPEALAARLHDMPRSAAIL